MEKHATLFRVDTKAVPLHFQSLLEISREECWLQRSQNTTAWRVFSLCAMGQGVELAIVVWQWNITWCSVLAWPENGIFHGDYSTLWAPPPRHFHSQSLSPSSGFPDSRQTAHSTAGIPTVLVTKAALSKFSEMGNSTTPQKNRLAHLADNFPAAASPKGGIAIKNKHRGWASPVMAPSAGESWVPGTPLVVTDSRGGDKKKKGGNCDAGGE